MAHPKPKRENSLGAALVEYAAAVCLIALVCVAGVTSVGKAIGEKCPAGDGIKTTTVLGKAIYFLEHAGEGGHQEGLPQGDGCYGGQK